MSTLADRELALRDKYKPRERRFECTFGHIAAMEWGREDAPNKVLCMHGWLDNAGSFERLIPFILDHKDNAQKYHIVAMDQPGLGLSSHKPTGSEYTTMNIVIEMRRVINQLKWNNVKLIGHSMGSSLCFLYSCIYNKEVESMVSIDLPYPMYRRVHNWEVTLANSIEEHFKCEYNHEDDPTTNIHVQVMSETDAIKRLLQGHQGSLTEESARIMLKRGATKSSWGYTFNRDLRHRYFSLEIRPDEESMLKYLSGPFKPNLLTIRSSVSPYHRSSESRSKFFALYEENCPIFRDAVVDGGHHLHMNSPDTVATVIVNFFDEVTSYRSMCNL